MCAVFVSDESFTLKNVIVINANLFPHGVVRTTSSLDKFRQLFNKLIDNHACRRI